jgi:hypothetical protein
MAVEGIELEQAALDITRAIRRARNARHYRCIGGRDT